LLLRALEIHGDKIHSEILAVTITSLLGALCDLGKLTPKQVQVLGVWILEGGFKKEGGFMKDDDTFNQIRKIVVDPVNRHELPSVAYLRLPVLRAEQVEAQNLQDKVQSLESIERMLPPARPEDN
jgi:hypothetical protein